MAETVVGVVLNRAQTGVGELGVGKYLGKSLEEGKRIESEIKRELKWEAGSRPIIGNLVAESSSPVSVDFTDFRAITVDGVG